MSKMTVKWYVAKKNLVKFAESEDAYAVVEGLTVEAKAGDKVEVEIEDKVVVKMEKLDTVQKEEKKEEKAETKEVKTEPEPSAEKEAPEVEPSTPAKYEFPFTLEEPVVVTWTVAAYSPKNAVIKFEEQESAKYWYPIKDKIVPSFEGINKGDKIAVKIGKVEATAQSGNRYMKDGIIAIDKGSIEKKEAPETPETKEEPKREVKRSDTNDSIERQVALKEAGAIVRSLIESGSEFTNCQVKIEKVLKDLTLASLDAMRNA